MIIAAFLAVCGCGSVLGLTSRSHDRIDRLIGVGFAAAAALLALLFADSSELTAGGVQLSSTPYSGGFLAAVAASGFGVSLVGLGTEWPGRLVPASLAALAGFAVAFSADDAAVAFVAAAAAAAAGALIVAHRPAPRNTDGRAGEIRTLGIVAGALVVAGIALARPSWSGSDDRALAVGFGLLALALAVRGGSVPFHVPAARSGRNSSPMGATLILVWIPAGVGVMAVSWSPAAFPVHSEWIDLAVASLQVVAVATLVLGGLAALLHDEIDEIAAYSIVADSAFVLLALAARTDAAAEPARLWLLVFVVAKTALLAWVAAVSHAFGSMRMGGLRGWLRRAPILGLALAAIVVATLGWPGSPVYEARSTLVRLALPSGLQFLPALAVVLSLCWTARLVLVGLMTPAEGVAAATGERPRWPRRAEARQPAGEAAEVTVAKGTAADETNTAEPAEPAEPSPTKEPSGSAESAQPVKKAEPAESFETGEPAEPQARRKRSRTAAARISRPTRSAPVPLSESEPEGPPPDGQQTDAEPGVPPVEASEPGDGAGSRDGRAGSSEPDRETAPLSRRLAAAWGMNRTLETSFAVAAAALLAVAVAAGSLGASSAAQWGIPLGTAAHATASPTPLPTLPPTQAPVNTGTPLPITPPPASGSIVPSGSPASPTPARSFAPQTPSRE
jgi:NADH:ubiquinone oxidoreductase subunit 2 (subunit N)